MIGPRFARQHRPMDQLGVECAWPSPSLLGTPRAQLDKRRSRARRLAMALALLMLLAGLWQIGRFGYIQGKAWAAQVLIEKAWSKTRGGESRAQPWPWADTWPVAHLDAPTQRASGYVLAGSNGRSIAFGPGHVFGTALPGSAGNSVIGAHRDTHFAFLRRLRIGDPIDIETPSGERVRYRVTEVMVAHKSETALLATRGNARELTLITCYPFDAMRAGGPLRYVVRAEEELAAGEEAELI